MILFQKLNETLSSDSRNSSIDVWRGIAILSVVLFHFDGYLPFGSIGVDLFFVISGLLVGGILTDKLFNRKPIKYFRFLLQRGFKIWPSYYVFIVIGTLIAVLFYAEEYSDQIIPFSDMKRYLLFYQNYTGEPFHWSFDHVWSLCVEEHFYILLPLLFITIKLIDKKNKILIPALLFVILLGFVFKYYMLYYTVGKDTYSATHNRIDALAWGVLLNVLLKVYGGKFKNSKRLIHLFFLGLIGTTMCIWFDFNLNSVFYSKVVYHSILPLFFVLMILGTYYINMSKIRPVRVLGYYSYNWYLWHPIIVVLVSQQFGSGWLALSFYLLLSFTIGVVFTLLIEEPFLKIRKRMM
ncbi:MAG: acyltransferase [Fluviicola sp.]|nr:acyltransferase [Fluviicola sp.]